MQSARRNKQICYLGVFKRHQIVGPRYKQLYRKRTTRSNQRKVSNNLPSPSTQTKRLNGMNTSNPWRKQETARKEQPSKINIKTPCATDKPPISPTSHQLYVFWCFVWVVANSSTAFCPSFGCAKNWCHLILPASSTRWQAKRQCFEAWCGWKLQAPVKVTPKSPQ